MDYDSMQCNGGSKSDVYAASFMLVSALVIIVTATVAVNNEQFIDSDVCSRLWC